MAEVASASAATTIHERLRCIVVAALASAMLTNQMPTVLRSFAELLYLL
jgi:hypothetical protein